MYSLKIGIKAAGDIASGVAWRLYMANIKKIFMMELASPLAVRRSVSFSEAVYDFRQTVEGVSARLAVTPAEVLDSWTDGQIAVVVDPVWEIVPHIAPDVVIDAIIGKKNMGTRLDEARLVIGLGPGFTAPRDVHMVIETNRGHNLGRIITDGFAEADTGAPGAVMGYRQERVLRAPAGGVFHSTKRIGDTVEAGDTVGTVASVPIISRIGGLLRGLIKPGYAVTEGLKVGDVDPRISGSQADTISDKARAISGAVLEAIMREFND